MWLWVTLFALLGVGGAVVLSLLGWRIYRKGRDLARAVAEASARLATAADALERATGTRVEQCPSERR
ncbi:MAG: hypothetical protein ACRDYU_19625 [Actinomycetes bacterium]